MIIGVVGLGYLGLTHSVAMALLGHTVHGVECDPVRLRFIRIGDMPFFEPGLESGLRKVLSDEKFIVTDNFRDLGPCDVVFLCVGTPRSEGSKQADLSFIQEACKELAPVLKEGAVVAGKSTVPVGTARSLQGFLQFEARQDIRVVWNPEFLREGSALEDSLNPNRIVIGGDSPKAIEMLKQVYESQIAQGTPLVECDFETAELVKVAANAFLATRISFINAIAEVSERVGADTEMVAAALGYDERIGPKYLRNGIGFGGGCLPKDIQAFMGMAEELGIPEAVSFLAEVEAINNRRRSRVVDIAKMELGELARNKILVLGISFKPDSDDMRDSPALDIALRLAKAGATVTVHDPVSLGALGDRHQELIREPDLLAAAQDQDLVILGTEWADYKTIDPGEFGKLVKNKLIIDGRNVLDVGAWQRAGWRLIALGRNVHN